MNATDFDAELAASMDAEPRLLPFLPELFQDLEDLGARSDDVVAILTEGCLRRGARVLDLGSGKGAAALAVARAFDAHVLGVDGMPAFVAHAAARALAVGLAERCQFQVGDVRAAVDVVRDDDLVMLLALGPVFGDAADTVASLRRCVRPGGLMLIDDAYLAAGVDPRELDLEHCFDRETTTAMLESHGDTLVAECSLDSADNERWLGEMTAKILERAEALAQREPQAAPLLRQFAQRQRVETEHLQGPLVGALWLLQRGSGA